MYGFVKFVYAVCLFYMYTYIISNLFYIYCVSIYIVFSTKLLNLAPKRPAPKQLCAQTSRAQTAAPKRPASI